MPFKFYFEGRRLAGQQEKKIDPVLSSQFDVYTSTL